MTAKPSRFGATIRSRPNGSLRTIAVIAAANRSPRAGSSPRPGSVVAFGNPACGMGSILVISGNQKPACPCPAGKRTVIKLSS
jgi:hypothetical protein